nr:MAG TPA: hypothetical protein [Caudoviricetes sp.]
MNLRISMFCISFQGADLDGPELGIRCGLFLWYNYSLPYSIVHMLL